MGADGAMELKQMLVNRALIIAQNKRTSAVHGMLGEAIRFGGACHSMTPEQIIRLLLELTSCTAQSSSSGLDKLRIK